MSSQNLSPSPHDNKPHDYASYHPAGYHGYDVYADEPQSTQKSLRDILAIARERKWYIILTFLLILGATLLYTFNATKIYTAYAIMEVQGRMAAEGAAGRIVTSEEMNTQIGILESANIIQRVAQRLGGSELRTFMAPYEQSGALTAAEILARNRSIQPRRASFLINVSYSHPNPEMASRIANIFVEEYISYNISQRISENLRSNQVLEEQARSQLEKVEEVQRRMISLQEQAGTVAINRASDYESQVFARLTETRTLALNALRDIETHWEQIQDARQHNKPLTDLPFINQLTLVTELQHKISQLEIDRSSYAERYGPMHPTMRQINEQLRSAKDELEKALASAVEKTRNELERSKRGMEDLEREVKRQEDRLLEISKLAVEYRSLEDELSVQRSIYAGIVNSMRLTTLSAGLENPNARPLDQAYPPKDPSSPRVLINIAAGSFVGLLAGAGLAFLISFLDDRVKSTFDVEKIVGLSVMGLIPRIKSSRAQEKSKAVFNNMDNLVTESFRTIYSSLKVHPEGKNAKVLLITSTIPGEGKSFLATNLAQTFAHNGQKTLLIDCDLRMPNVAKSLSINNKTGLVSCIHGESSLEDSIQKDVFPNLDIITSGGQTRNPLPIINSDMFQDLLKTLGQQYDKIIIDTPPIAPVSDALNMTQYVDGVIYAMKFNLVKKRTARQAIKRLLDTNVTVFGAVLNDIQARGAGYYLYTDYYDKSFSRYYAPENPKKKNTKAAVKSAKGKEVAAT